MLRGIKKIDYVQILQSKGVVDSFNELSQDLTCRIYCHSMIASNKDRFSDIKTSDSNIIQGLGTKYFNGSYILGNKYIATQYPLYNTINDFWNMIQTTSSKVIVNLTGNNSYLRYNTNHNVEVKSYFADNTLKVNKIVLNGDNKKTIYYISFNKWVDHGVPSIEDFERLMAIVNLYEDLYKDNPLVVHCHAGVGRAGTFILTHYLLDQIKKYKIYWHPTEALKIMRSTRAGMIQNKKQFKFSMKYICKELTPKDKTVKKLKKRTLNRSFECGLECLNGLNKDSLYNSTGHLNI